MSAMISEEDQERYLDRGLKNIKAQSFHIHNTIDKNNLRQCLKETYIMLCELRTNALTPKNYYHLYSAAFDEMQIIENFMKEEIERGRKVKDLYDSVQQAQFLIPRLYLMICAGSIYMEKEPKSSKEVMFDLLGVVKGVQNPIRGLFCRYYLMKMIKDKLPDKDNVYLKEGGAFEDTLNFILNNLDEMNRLWIRLSTGVVGNEKLIRDKERNELKILVGESVNRLSNLDGLTPEIYEKTVLPKLLEIILDSQDQLSQQYLMECIIHAFPDSFNIKCMELILRTSEKLIAGVDVKGLFISLMEKLAKFVGESTGEQASQEDRELLQSAQNIYPLLVGNYNSLLQESLQQGPNMDIIKILDMNCSFMKFSIKCSPENEKLNAINHILSSSVQCLAQFNLRLSLEGIKKLGSLLAASLESPHSLFDFTDFANLMSFLDYTSRKSLGLKIIESLVGGTSKELLDTTEKVQKLLSFIQPLLRDTQDAVEQDQYSFEYEQNAVAKVIFVCQSKDPAVLFEVYGELKNVFAEGGPERRRFTLPSLGNSVIYFAHRISLAFDNQNGLLMDKDKTPIINELTDSIDVTKITISNFHELMSRIFQLINDIIRMISDEQPIVAFKMNLAAASQVNSIKSSQKEFENECFSFLSAAIDIYREGKFDQDLRASLMSEISGYILNFSILGQDNLYNLFKLLNDSILNMVKRNDQFNSMIVLSQLYYTSLKDPKMTMSCLNKAKKYADFAISNPHNLVLFVQLLNKIIYFIEQKDFKEVNLPLSNENVEDIIETFKNHLQTIKSEANEDLTFIPDIENYFKNTIDIIVKRKNEEGHNPIYDNITL